MCLNNYKTLAKTYEEPQYAVILVYHPWRAHGRFIGLPSMAVEHRSDDRARVTILGGVFRIYETITIQII
jgi:hypothetical protein